MYLEVDRTSDKQWPTLEY